MRVSIVGTGNSGSAVLMNLANREWISSIQVVSHRLASAEAAMMDSLSAFPKLRNRIKCVNYEEACAADVITICAGVQIKRGMTAQDVHDENRRILEEICSRLSVKQNCIVVVIASPVDDIVCDVEKMLALDSSRVIGFGGDLDRNRLLSVLGISDNCDDVTIVGEHGKCAIPVYPSEEHYAETASRVRTFLKSITESAGPPRNLATGVLLPNLLESIATDASAIHFVNGFHRSYGIRLTWPFRIGRDGIRDPIPVHLGLIAQAELESLLEIRRKRHSEK